MEVWQVTGFYSAGLLYDSSGPWLCGMFLFEENAKAHVKKLEEAHGPMEYGQSPLSSKGYSFSISGPYPILDSENT